MSEWDGCVVSSPFEGQAGRPIELETRGVAEGVAQDGPVPAGPAATGVAEPDFPDALAGSAEDVWDGYFPLDGAEGTVDEDGDAPSSEDLPL